ALRVPGVQRAQLVDDPAFAATCRDRRDVLPRRLMAEPVLLVDALVEQELDVVEQKLPALFERDLERRLAGSFRRRLLKDPRIAERAAADQHAGHRRAREPRRYVRRLDAVAGTENGNAQTGGDLRN